MQSVWPLDALWRRAAGRFGGGIAAAVCYRAGDDGDVELYLVSTKDGARWTFPKGHREPGETMAEAAAREAHEEAGVLGTVDERRLTEYRYPSRRGGDDRIEAFLLRVTGVEEPVEMFRTRLWCSRESARARLAEGREPRHAAELDRVVTAAVEAVAASPRRRAVGVRSGARRRPR